VVTIGLMLISAPFWIAMVRRLGSERVARARSEERSEVAAHLHDSVLQTLALIQKRSDDPEQVARLARRQERDLREWLSDDQPTRPDERLADALRAAAAEIEDSHGTLIEAIVVGDAAIDERTGALVAAAREALTNAAKFAAEGGPVRLYAEIEDDDARVFIDDRGPGFDPAAIPDHRHGVRESIIGRMKRHGGHAAIRSEPGDGTEVELSMRLNGR
jgi:signal transduction histidine kinase